MERTITFTAILVAIAFTGASATIINVPDDYETIQEGIDASTDGDTVLVQPGTYVENINFNGHNVVLGSLFLTTGDTSYISSTIIDGNQSSHVVAFGSGEGSTAIIIGFTIQNGSSDPGGGIHCWISNPTIDNNIITGNSALAGGGIYCYQSNPTIVSNSINQNSATGGGGIYCSYSYPTIINNIISGNSVTGNGGGINCYSSSPVVTNNVINENSANIAGGLYCHTFSNPTISNNIISGNSANYAGGVYCYNSTPVIVNNTISANSANAYGGGIYCFESSPTITNNTITGNSANVSGGGIYCELVSNPTITNTIFWADSASYSAEIDFDDSSSPYFTYCDIQGGWGGEGNIDVDPLFRDPENFDFHLKADSCGDVYNSPCIDAGDPAIFDSMLGCDWGLGELRSDMGAYGGEGIPTDVDEEQTPDIPLRFLLSQNYPNPFNASTTISFSLPEARFVQLTVYDLLGREIRTLTDEFQQAGIHHFDLNASDLASGIYFYQLQAGESVASRRMVLLK